MSIQRWENWHHMFRLWKALDDPGLSDPGWRKPRNFYKLLPDAVLEDGQRIDFEDEAVAHFLKMLYLDTSYQHMTLEDVCGRVNTSFLTDFNRPGFHSYNSTEMDRLMALREAPGGWAQLDRVIKQISGSETFSGIVDRKHGVFLTHPEDQGLGGKTCFSIGVLTYYDGSDAKPYQALASEPKYAMALIEQVLARFDRTSNPWDCDYKKPSQIWIELNGVSICSFSLKCTSGDELPYEGVVDKDGIACFSVTEPQWRDFSWSKHDVKLMNAFASAAPAEARRYIKGNFLTDELGV
jgi:hypothetical protein